LNFCWEEGGKERHVVEHAVAASRIWEEEGSPFLSPCIYTSHKLRWGVWGWFRCVLVRVLVYLKPILPLPFGSLRQPDFFPNFQLGQVIIDLEINKNNCVATDSEIDS